MERFVSPINAPHALPTLIVMEGPFVVAVFVYQDCTLKVHFAGLIIRTLLLVLIIDILMALLQAKGP